MCLHAIVPPRSRSSVFFIFSAELASTGVGLTHRLLPFLPASTAQLLHARLMSREEGIERKMACLTGQNTGSFGIWNSANKARSLGEDKPSFTQTQWTALGHQRQSPRAVSTHSKCSFQMIKRWTRLGSQRMLKSYFD